MTQPGTLGELPTIATMIFGISLLVRIALAIVRPHKVVDTCPQCGSITSMQCTAGCAMC